MLRKPYLDPVEFSYNCKAPMLSSALFLLGSFCTHRKPSILGNVIAPTLRRVRMLVVLEVAHRFALLWSQTCA